MAYLHNRTNERGNWLISGLGGGLRVADLFPSFNYYQQFEAIYHQFRMVHDAGYSLMVRGNFVISNNVMYPVTLCISELRKYKKVFCETIYNLSLIFLQLGLAPLI